MARAKRSPGWTAHLQRARRTLSAEARRAKAEGPFFSVVTKGAAGEALKDSARLSRLLVEGISRTLPVALARDSSPIEGERTRILHRLRLADHDQETPASPSMGEAPAKRAEGV